MKASEQATGRVSKGEAGTPSGAFVLPPQGRPVNLCSGHWLMLGRKLLLPGKGKAQKMLEVGAILGEGSLVDKGERHCRLGGTVQKTPAFQ